MSGIFWSHDDFKLAFQKSENPENPSDRCPPSTPRDPPDGKTGEIVFIGYVIYRKITSDLSLTCRRANRPNVRTMSMSSDASKSRDFKLVAFCEQTGCRFCGFDGAPLRPPSSYPPSANRAKRTGSEFGMTVSLKTITSVGFEGGWRTQGHSCTIPPFEACWFSRSPSLRPSSRRQTVFVNTVRHGTLRH